VRGADAARCDNRAVTTTFIGVDLAWQGNRNHSGVAVARANERGAELVALSSGLTTLESVADFIESHATDDTVVAIDAPLVITNLTGRRACESLVSRKFGARHAGAHSSNLTLYPGGGPVALVEMLRRRGFAHDLDIERAKHRGGRWIFEVYPHPAQVVFFDLPRIIRYKKGSAAEKRAGLAALRGYLSETLPDAEPALVPGETGVGLTGQDLASLGGIGLKRYEDLLDAWFCAYLALYLWWWGSERNEMLGDLAGGYIVVPTHPLRESASPPPLQMPLLPPGTRVVAHAAVPILETGARLPAGAVGMIVRTPAEDAHGYRLRFPDGSEASLQRAQFSILKTMKESGLRQAANDLDVDWQQYVIYKCVVGSRAFGLDNDESDTDRRGFFLPPARLHWSLYGVPEQLENHATQETYWEIQKFIRMALKADPNTLECLYTPLVEEATELARELLSIRGIFLSKRTYQTHNGYVLSQFKKLEQDLRARGAIKWKHAMHLIRLLISGITILREQHVPVRVSEHRERLLAIRAGEMPWEDVDRWRLELHREFDEAFRVTRLPEQPDFERANAFLLKARRSMIEA
jgi:hypothetical protein